jgi:hypothetical protein
VQRLSDVKYALVILMGAVLFWACSTTPSGDTVQGFFSPPQGYPGPTWTRDGEDVDAEELNTIAGPAHCQWQQTVMMHLGWPLGVLSETSREFRQFIRDPEGIIDDDLSAQLRRPAGLPADAEDTRYRLGDLELWLSPSDPDGAYLRVGRDVERWPRAEPPVACA